MRSAHQIWPGSLDRWPVLLAVMLPGLVVLLVVLAAVERFGRWYGPHYDETAAWAHHQAAA